MPIITGLALKRFLRKKRVIAARRRAEICRQEAIRNPEQAWAWREQERYQEELANKLSKWL